MKRGLPMGILPVAVVAAFVAYQCSAPVYSLNIVSYVNVTPSPPPPPTVTDHFWMNWTRLGGWGFEQYRTWDDLPKAERLKSEPFKAVHLRARTVFFLGRLVFEVPMPAWILGAGTVLLLGIAATPGIYYGAGRRRRVQTEAPVLD